MSQKFCLFLLLLQLLLIHSKTHTSPNSLHNLAPSLKEHSFRVLNEYSDPVSSNPEQELSDQITNDYINKEGRSKLKRSASKIQEPTIDKNNDENTIGAEILRITVLIVIGLIIIAIIIGILALLAFAFDYCKRRYYVREGKRKGTEDILLNPMDVSMRSDTK